MTDVEVIQDWTKRHSGSVARYTVTVTVTRALRPEEWDPGFPEQEHIESYTDRAACRDLEKEIVRALRTLDGDCDCEVMAAEIESE